MSRRTRPPPAGPVCLVWTASGPATLQLPAGTRVVTELAEAATGRLALTSAEGFLLQFGCHAAGGRRGGAPD